MQNPFFHRRSRNLKRRLPSLKPLSSYDQRTHITARMSCCMRVQTPALWLSTEITAIPTRLWLLLLLFACSCLKIRLSLPNSYSLEEMNWIITFFYRIKNSHYISMYNSTSLTWDKCLAFLSLPLPLTFFIVWMQWNHLWAVLYIWLVCERFCLLFTWWIVC